jgi:aryl-alcohol dehydrogenase-like predicted oxidoreductase
MAHAATRKTLLGDGLLQKRRLGQTDIEVSTLGLGTVKFGRNQGVKYPHAFVLPSDSDIADLLAVAKELGINLVDTAPAYGISEERLGKALRGQRDHWVITTKAGEEFVEGESHFDFSKEAITNSVERSLQRLYTDYLDVVLVHSNGDDERIIHDNDVFTVLDQLKDAGKIRAYGFSGKTITGGKLAVDLSDVAMVSYNSQYTDEREVIHYAQQKQKGILIKKAFASGHLPAADSLRFALAEPGVTSVIVGTLNAEHLKENVSTISK